MEQYIRNFQELKVEGKKKISIMHSSFNQMGAVNYYIRTFNHTSERQVFEGEALFLQFKTKIK